MPVLRAVTLAALLFAARASAEDPPTPAAPPPAEVTAAAPEPEYNFVSHGLVLGLGIGTSPVGDGLVAQLGGNTFGLRSYDDRRWLLQWEGFLGAKAAILANTWPVALFVGGRAGGMAEFGHRFLSPTRWSPYLGGRLSANLQLMAHPGLAFDALNTLNASDGVGGVTASGGARVAAGASFLESERSLLLVAFVQEGLRAPGIITPGAAFTEGGLAARFDLGRSLSLSAEAFGGFTVASTNDALHFTDQLFVLGASGSVRKTFDSGLWLSLAVSVARDSHHVVYTATKTAYDSINPPFFDVLLAFGVPLGRQR